MYILIRREAVSKTCLPPLWAQCCLPPDDPLPPGQHSAPELDSWQQSWSHETTGVCLRWAGCRESLGGQRDTHGLKCGCGWWFRHNQIILQRRCLCVLVCAFRITSWCSGGELWVKMKSVFRSPDRRFEWRPHFLPVQLLQRGRIITTATAQLSKSQNYIWSVVNFQHNQYNRDRGCSLLASP